MPIATAKSAPPQMPPAPPDARGRQAPLAATGSAPPQGISGLVVVLSIFGILLGFAVSALLNRSLNPAALKIPAGISVFALFYVVTQGLERLLEPFASLWDTTQDATKDRDKAVTEAEQHQAAGQVDQAEDKLKEAAQKQAVVDRQRGNRAIVLWAVASVLGMLLSAILGLYLLHVVGLQDDMVGGDGRLTGSLWSAEGVRHSLDLLVTGLAIGGGTKPLHDLIKNLQEAKNDKKDPPQVR